MTDWLMVIITFVYVVATIFICVANFKSAKASNEQLAESKRQFDEQNRPYMSCQYVLENRAICGIKFYNCGNMPASDVTFKINEDFLQIVSFDGFKELNNAKYLFGVGQDYVFYFSTINQFNEHSKCPFEVVIKYSYNGCNYSDKVVIHFEKMLPVESVKPFEEEIIDALKEQSQNIDKNTKAINSIKEQLKCLNNQQQ